MVAHRNRDAAPLARPRAAERPGRRPCQHLDCGALVTVFERVVEQVLEYLDQLVEITSYWRQVGRDIKDKAHATRLRPRLQRVSRLPQRDLDTHRFGRRLMLIHLDA